MTCLLQCGHIRSNTSCICAGVFEKCTWRPDEYLAPSISLLQHSDVHKSACLHFAAQHSGTVPEAPSNSPGFCIHMPVQRSLPESRSFCTTALAPDEQADPDISLLSPLLQSQWDHPVDAHLGNRVIKPHSHIKVWWTCTQCPDGQPHKWLATPDSRSGRKGRQGRGCPFCASQKVCQHNSLPTKAPHLIPEWSEKNERSPHEFTVSSHKKAWWQCKCGCQWEATIKSRTGLGSGCPDCASVRRGGIQKRHPTLTESQHEMLNVWDWELNDKAGLDPSKLTCCSGRRAHWLCNKCPVGQPHRWQATVSHMYTATSRGTSGCPCCVGKQACKCNSLQSLFPRVAAEWDYERNKGTPAEYAAQSNKKVWWRTSRGHFKARIDHCTWDRNSKHQTAGKTSAPASSCDVSPMRPAYKTSQLAALTSPAVWRHAGGLAVKRST